MTATAADVAALDQLSVTTIRTLAIDAVQRAGSGHPGTPMAMAPVAYALWQRHLRFDPGDPIWPNRDRFVLSAGHASTLLYALLHLAGVKAVNPAYEVVGEPAVALADLERFRQLDSRCPGHPEHRWTSGIETTTGPLGQGVATSVGMAIAAQWQAAHFNRPGFELVDYDVYAVAGDGCMMEGISGEAASLAGHLKLSNLSWIYDNNRITIEGATPVAFSEDVATRFLGYGWNVLRVGDANDLDRLSAAFAAFEREAERPTPIVVDSHIGYGSPAKQDTSAAHGEPLGEDEVRATKRAYGWPEDATFHVPDEVRAHFAAGIGARGRAQRERWLHRFAAYSEAHPELATEVLQMQRRELPAGWDRDIPDFEPDAKGVSGRDASAHVLNAVAARVPWLVGGSADLSPSTKTRLTFEGAGDFSATDRGGRNLHFGVREHAMGAVLNGLAVSKIRPFGSGFLIFSDYGRTPIRLGALMETPTIHVFTHDSIGVGEDGPTHQPVEQLLSLRAIPGLVVLRPGDANEVAEAWRLTMQLQHDPVVMVLSRQSMPTLDRARYAPASGVARGGYVLGGAPEVILIAHGHRGRARRRRVRAPRRRRRRRPRGVASVLGAVRPPAAGVPRPGAAALRHRPRRDRASRHGVVGTLGDLSERGLVLGLTTGGVEPAARIKLERAGLNRFFGFGGFGSDSPDRTALTRRAVGRAGALVGARLRTDQVMVVGDTPLDIAAARGAGATAVGVATGHFSADELRASGADIVLGSLAEPLPL